MKKLSSALSSVEIHHYRNLLEAEGIPCVIRNQHLASVLGDIPLFETSPQLWVVNDLDYDRAKHLISDEALAESPSAPWRCKQCGEENEGQFAACWKCGNVAV